jgi:hypothetical protein
MWREIDGLRHQTVGQLKVKYRAVFGQESRSNHKQFLVRRIAWRLQANAEGDLSERARQRALALAQETDLRIRAPESFLRELSGAAGKWRGYPRDRRLPRPGTWLTRQFRGQSVAVEVLEKGFRYQERVYKSLSAVARHVTGTQWNGFAFFARAQRKSAGSARIGSDRTRGRGRDLVGVNGDVSSDKVTKSRGGTDR